MERLELNLPIESVTIEKCIPHRYPFLLVDRVNELVPSKKIIGIKNVSLSDPILQGHFPDQPLYPGVLLLEGMAQTSLVLAYFSKPNGFKEVLLTEVSKARFRRQVLPGDTIQYCVEIDRMRGSFNWFTGTATVGDEVVATCSFSALVK